MVTLKSFEPGSASWLGVFGEGELVVPIKAGPEPGGGVAEALTGIFAPAAGAVTTVAGAEGVFPPFGGPAEFAGEVEVKFLREKGFPGASLGVGEAGPDEMEEFVDEDPGALGGLAAERGVEDEEAFAGKTGGVDGLSGSGAGFEAAAASMEAAAPFDQDRLALKGADGGESPDQGWA